MREKGRVQVRERRRWSSSEKLALVERWKRSGVSRAAFCRQEGLCYSNFLVWVAEWTNQQASGPEFVEVVEGEQWPKAVGEGRRSGSIELLAPNGWLVRLGGAFESRDLQRVVEVLGQC